MVEYEESTLASVQQLVVAVVSMVMYMAMLDSPITLIPSIRWFLPMLMVTASWIFTTTLRATAIMWATVRRL